MRGGAAGTSPHPPWSERELDRPAERARIADIADDQAGAARRDRELIEVVHIERIADPAEDIDAAVRPEAEAEVRQRIAIDIGVGRGAGVRRP